MKIIKNTGLILALFVGFGCSVANAEMFKCVDKNGKAKYQTTKCPIDAVVKVIANADKVNELEAAKSQLRSIEAAIEIQTDKAIKNHQVILGMSKESVTKSIGSPSSIHKTGILEQWVYPRNKSIISNYVYFNEYNKVSSFDFHKD